MSPDDFETWKRKSGFPAYVEFKHYVLHVIDKIGKQSEEYRLLANFWGENKIQEIYEKAKGVVK